MREFDWPKVGEFEVAIGGLANHATVRNAILNCVTSIIFFNSQLIF